MGRPGAIARLGLVIGTLAVSHIAIPQAQAEDDIPKAVGKTVEVGRTGFDVRRPVFAAACPQACPWGELGEFVRDAMLPLGYEVILCRNCNRTEGPRVVGNASLPPPLDEKQIEVGTTTRVNATVDFGVTESGFLAWAYHGRYFYEQDGPLRNLRVIARLEDPTYLLVAVKADSPINDLAQITKERLPVKVFATMSPTTIPVLEYYGLSAELLQAQGGSLTNAMTLHGDAPDFDVLISDLASPANNPESAYWNAFAQSYELRFLNLAEQLIEKMAADEALGMRRVVAKWGLLRGLDRSIPTVGRSGEVIFARADMPESAAYDAAKAIDENRNELIWYVRPYSYDPRTVWKNYDVPLHPGAERYYREKGYLRPNDRVVTADDTE